MTYFKETNADSLIKWPIFLVINSQLFLLYNFSKFLYIFTLFIHPSTLNITNKTPHCPDDGSAEPKRYSVDWLCFSINPHFLFGLLVFNFSSKIVGLLSIIFFHIYIFLTTGSGTPQDTNCTATCPLSRNLFKLGEPDLQDIAGEAEMNS